MANGKMYYRMGEVSEMTGLEAHVIRFWESEFPELNPKKSRSGHRTFTQGDIDLILRIKRLVHGEGFTIAGAQKKMTAGKRAPEQAEPALVKHRLAEEIKGVKAILENVLNMLDPS